MICELRCGSAICVSCYFFMNKYILIINAGSSSLKYKLFSDRLKSVSEGIVEKIGQSGSFLDYRFKNKEEKIVTKIIDHDAAMVFLMKKLSENKVKFAEIVKVGHRVVHGGEKFTKPTLVTADFLKELKKYNKLAPLHNPKNIAGMEACLKALPQAKNYAVFDTAFHTTIPDFVSLYALPYRFYKKYGIKKYGFHGLSHQYVSLEAAKRLKKNKPNLITCHLGSGCSITVIKAGKSVDTSMGFTPLEGLMMASRTGDIDPAVIFFLLNEGMSPAKINHLLNFESGLRGVSGLQDMRDIMIANGYKVPGYKMPIKLTTEQKYLARLALQMFVYHIKKYIGAYSAILGKVDAIVFTAGMGERNKDIRDLIVRGLLGKPKILVIPTNEELMIARLIT